MPQSVKDIFQHSLTVIFHSLAQNNNIFKKNIETAGNTHCILAVLPLQPVVNSFFECKNTELTCFM